MDEAGCIQVAQKSRCNALSFPKTLSIWSLPPLLDLLGTESITLKSDGCCVSISAETDMLVWNRKGNVKVLVIQNNLRSNQPYENGIPRPSSSWTGGNSLCYFGLGS